MEEQSRRRPVEAWVCTLNTCTAFREVRHGQGRELRFPNLSRTIRRRCRSWQPLAAMTLEDLASKLYTPFPWPCSRHCSGPGPMLAALQALPGSHLRNMFSRLQCAHSSANAFPLRSISRWRAGYLPSGCPALAPAAALQLDSQLGGGGEGLRPRGKFPPAKQAKELPEPNRDAFPRISSSLFPLLIDSRPLPSPRLPSPPLGFPRQPTPSPLSAAS